MKKILMRPMIVVLVLGVTVGCSKLPDEWLMEKGKKFEEEMAFSEAIASYEKLAKLYPQGPLTAEALYRAGLVYTNGLQDFPKAVSTLRRVIEEHPDNAFAAQSQFMIGFIYANNAPDTAKSRLAYRTFLEKYPDHELVPSVEWELKYLGKGFDEIPELSGLDAESSTKSGGDK